MSSKLSRLAVMLAIAQFVLLVSLGWAKEPLGKPREKPAFEELLIMELRAMDKQIEELEASGAM